MFNFHDLVKLMHTHLFTLHLFKEKKKKPNDFPRMFELTEIDKMFSLYKYIQMIISRTKEQYISQTEVT